ncbi:MAG TPA: hypothetical protein VGM39_16615 [Kofleriaceae bacterium]|jgi:hypothetical protein
MSPSELDRLIEEGLTLYGSGDLDGALLVWEKVLSEEPDNEQANSYVDYVRMNYDMLTSEPGEDPAPYGIANDEPEYMIEISDGELPQVPNRGATAPMYMDPTDAGWAIEEERVLRQPAVTVSNVDDLDDADAPPPISIEMEADEPDEVPPPKPQRAKTENFDDATREYEGPRRTSTRDFEGDQTGEFGNEATPGFGASEMTEHKKRDMGFVRTATPQAPSEPPPELKMTLRTPTDAIPTIAPPPPERSAFDISYAAVDLDDVPAGEHAPLTPVEPDDLIASLPSPTPSPLARDLVRAPTKPPPSRTTTDQLDPHRRRTAVQAAIDLIDLDLPDPMADTPPATAKPPTMPPPMAPMPAHTFHSLVPPQPPRKPLTDPPATQRKSTADQPVIPTAPTRDLSHLSPSAKTRDMKESLESSFQQDPIVSAPTRELGLRPPTHQPRVPTEDEPTSIKHLQVRDFDEQPRQGTRADIVLPFDPIDARAAQILDEVDAHAPDEENKDDRTRRRITTLLERATLWLSVDLDRAVAAVDLALGEDPNSALAQKLIHRNRDAIMSVFQAFLGDLERQPELAKPLHELAAAPISPRAAFLLSRVDGILSLDEILDVSGMPRLEAYRYLCQLFLRGILR